MSARAGRWELLEHGSTDPVPGDELVVQRMATVYRETGNAIQESSDTLRKLADLDGWTGHAATSFAKHAHDLAGDLIKAKQRYTDAGEALQRFVTPLCHARDESAGALSDAVEAHGEMERNAGNSLAGVAQPTPEQTTAQDARDKAHGEAAGRLHKAQQRLTDALSALDTAAKTCAGAISDAAKHDKDGRWDNIKGGLRDFADWAHLDAIAKALAWVGIALAAILIVVALVATAPAWLLTAAIVVAAAALAADLVLTVSEHEGGSWVTVGIDAVALLTAGASKFFSGAARESAAVARGSAAASAAGSARTAEAARLAQSARAEARIANALKTATTNPLHIWAEGQQAARAATVARAGGEAADLVTSSVERTLAKEIVRLQAIPHPTPQITAQLHHALEALENAERADRAGALAALATGVDKKAHTNATFEDYLATTEWELTR